jgi:hypothetical protein
MRRFHLAVMSYAVEEVRRADGPYPKGKRTRQASPYVIGVSERTVMISPIKAREEHKAPVMRLRQ